jgi:NCAIR mutase (PurE)-related protein
MDKAKIKKILKLVKEGKTSVDIAMKELRHLPYEDLGFAKVDHHRVLRQGIPEVIFAKDKKRKDIAAIADSMLKKSGRLMVTKAGKDVRSALVTMSKRHNKNIKYYERSGVITIGEKRVKKGMVAVLCAGTSDLPVAEETLATTFFLGSKATLLSDVGVAGLHRLKNAEKLLSEANVVVVIAGMEGALPSVIGGITGKPIIAVPTSTGYGTSFGGLTALFAMLNSCVPGIAVMNIDNGFGAGVLAHKINTLTTNNS